MAKNPGFGVMKLEVESAAPAEAHDEMMRIVDRYEPDVLRCLKIAPHNAVVILANDEGVALGFLQGLGVAEKFVLRPKGYLVVSVPDEIVHKLFEAVGTPLQSRHFFRFTPAANIVVIANGRTGICGVKPEGNLS